MAGVALENLLECENIPEQTEVKKVEIGGFIRECDPEWVKYVERVVRAGVKLSQAIKSPGVNNPEWRREGNMLYQFSGLHMLEEKYRDAEGIRASEGFEERGVKVFYATVYWLKLYI